MLLPQPIFITVALEMSATLGEPGYQKSFIGSGRGMSSYPCRFWWQTFHIAQRQQCIEHCVSNILQAPC